MPSKVSITLETITPEVAHKYLAKSFQNRALRPKIITSYAADMRRGLWRPYPAIEFDEDGTLINAHHRLNAEIMANVPVEMYVVRGVPRESFDKLDGGVKRTLTDQLKLTRPKMKYINENASAVRLCAYLLTGTNVPINNPDNFDQWYSIFREGIAWAMETLVSHSLTKTAPTTGGLAFAYAFDPEAIQKLGEQTLSQVGLENGDPALVLVKALTNREPGGGSGINYMVRRVLNVAKAQVHGERIYNASASDKGRLFFVEHHKERPSVKKMMEIWK